MVHKHREMLNNRNAIFSLCEASCEAQFKPDVTSFFVGWCIYENFRSLLPHPWDPGTALSRVSHGVSSFSLPHLHGARGMGTNKQFVGALLMESLHFHNVTCKLSWFWRYLSLQLESIAVPFLIIHQVTFFARIFTDFVGSVAFCLLRSNSIKYCVDVLTS